MALADVLNNLTGARDALVTAINNKGGTVAASATLRQCAEAVTDLPEGGGGGVEIPGQIFHASFAEDSEYAESGQPLVKIGRLVFSTIDGIPCVRLGEGGFQVDYPLFTGDKPFTISYFGKCVTENDPGPLTVHQGQFSVNRAVFVTHNAGNFHASNSNGFTTAIVSEKFIFHHYLVTYDQKKFRLFVDNEQLAESSSEFSLNIPRDPFYIGYNSQSINTNQFYLANMKIFTRVLSADEISTLYEEFRRATGSGGDVSVDPVGELFFTTTEADGKVEGGYMFAGTGTLKLQLATGEITELSLTDTMQRAFSAYELSNVRVVSGAESVTLLSINRIGIDYIDLSNFWSLEHLHMPISSSPEIKNLSSCHRLNYVDVGDSALSSAQVDQLLADILASNSHLNSESFSGSIDVSQNAVPTAAGLETIAQLESVGWSVNYDRE